MVCEHLPNFPFINRSQRIWSFFQQIQVSFTFQIQRKKRKIPSFRLGKKHISLEKQIFLFSLIFFQVKNGWWGKQKSWRFLGLFETDVLIDLFWSLHDACWIWHVQFGYSHGLMDQILHTSWQYWSQKQKSPPKGIETIKRKTLKTTTKKLFITKRYLNEAYYLQF